MSLLLATLSGGGPTIVEADASSSSSSSAAAIGVALALSVAASSGQASVNGIGGAIAESVASSGGLATALAAGENAGSVTPPVVPPSTGTGGGVDEAMGAVFYRGPEWSHELDEDEFIEIVSCWLMK